MKKFLSRMFNSLPKRLAAVALVALAIALPASSLAAETVNFSAKTSVANNSKGESLTSMQTSTNASYNQVLYVEVSYNNNEVASSTKTVNNLHVKFTVPTTAGTQQTVTTTTTGDNIATVNGSATINLDRSDAYLQYIPGTAVWKHANVANGPSDAVQQSIADTVVTSADGFKLGSENPCEAGAVAIQVGVYLPGVSINKEVRAKGGKAWAKSIDAKAGDTVQYRITYENTGNTLEQNVAITDILPKGMTFVPGSTYWYASTSPDTNGDGLPDGAYTDVNVTNTALVVGSFTPNQQEAPDAYVVFDAVVPSEDKLELCGTNLFRNIGTAQPQGMNVYYNTADVNVNKTCTPPPVTPTYSCDEFHVKLGDNRKVTVDKFKFTASDKSTLTSATINWGDTTTLGTNTVLGETHQYAKDGTYTISLSNFKVDGKSVTVSGNCSQPVTITTPGTPTPPTTPKTPTVLPNTGAGDVIGIFGAVTVLGAFAHRMFLSRRLAR
jgi:uncharacterized repeat protein (TIGR01451 family)